MVLLVLVVGGILYLLLRPTPAHSAVISNSPEFDPVTAAQVTAAAAGQIPVGTDYATSAIASPGTTGNPTDGLPSNASTAPIKIIAPATDDALLSEEAQAVAEGS